MYTYIYIYKDDNDSLLFRVCVYLVSKLEMGDAVILYIP